MFTFNFKIIAKGTAPGPKNNQKLLEEYSHSNISDSYPLYYGVKYQSASGLPITVAFKDRKSAIDYAYSYEKGRVEELSDGTYKYNGSFLGVENSIKFDENIGKESPKVLYAFAEKAVHLYYFDLSDDSTYMTLRQSDIDKKSNLREYALNRSVVIYNDGEKELLTDLDTLPIISRKPYAYINPGDKGVVDMGYNDFEFIRDKYVNEDETQSTFIVGMIPYVGECVIPQEEFDEGLVVYNADYSDTETTFILGYTSEA